MHEQVFLNSCLVCGHNMGAKFVDLGQQPLPNSSSSSHIVSKYTLSTRICNICYHSQLDSRIDTKQLFTWYPPMQEDSVTMNNYYLWLVDYVLDKQKNASKVLEIGCNSGYVLKMFSDRGLECVGVDPAQNLKPLSAGRNIQVHTDYWNMQTANGLEQKFDIILGLNVLQTVGDPYDFLSACKKVLDPKGRIILQTPHCEIFTNNQFDLMNHENLSYFNARSIMQLAHNVDLGVTDIIKTSVNGACYLFTLENIPLQAPETKLDAMIDMEQTQGLYSEEKYKKFSYNVIVIKEQLIDNLNQLRSQGYTIIAYGVNTKTITLLNFVDMPLDYLIDRDVSKHGLTVPGTNVKIDSTNLLMENQFDKICFIPLEWTMYSEIKQEIKTMRDSDQDIFVRYNPFYKLA